ncbi:alkaline phosphatase [Chitinophaga sp. GCM10012297]|uniref:Alkaline phosphatase n=1 Tax=Chitinophaga chungangae TaxID=2821488 RepID=A0ABS3YAV4_9BACT|nr:alkaline phosphatase [Chitinophaga chungangae]MBO9151284.1 alkaline phosphatase [Chitinophaga chungangae]
MKRRQFLQQSSLAALAASIFAPAQLLASGTETKNGEWDGTTARNIIFLVSDGMSIGTLSMTNILLHRKEGRSSAWMELYEQGKAKRGLMDTASANNLVTDSAAGSSAWGGGVRVPNGMLNVNADGSFNTPILQKFKAAGKATGCVTTVPITHATPAGFCVNNASRNAQPGIAEQYLQLRFDVMMGGGTEFFSAEKRPDKQDLFAKYAQAGFSVARTKQEMLDGAAGQPLMAVFHEDAIPYSIDHIQDTEFQATIPTLAEMTKNAIDRLNKNKKGFVLQVEGGKVDWGAHSNDLGGLVYDQVAFDEAIRVAVDFAEKDKNTLIIITTDHGNANPGIFGGSKDNKKFDSIFGFKHTNDWILKGINKDFTASQVRERVEAALGFTISPDEARQLLGHYARPDGEGLYNKAKLPFKELGEMLGNYTTVRWASMDHSGDHVELTMLGPGSELLKPFMKNTELHNLMLEAAGVKKA